MLVPRPRTISVPLLPLATCGLLMLVGCDNSGCPGQTKPDKDTPSANAGGNDEDASPESKALCTLVAQLQDPNPEVRWKAARALAPWHLGLASGDKEGRFDFTKNEQHRETALAALGQALRDKDDTVCHFASESLRSYEKHAVPVFLEALKDQNAAVRREAAGGLGELAYYAESAIPALGEVLLKDQDPGVRRTAAYALANIGKPGVPVLITALKSPDRETRLLTVSSFHRFSQYGERRRDARQAIPVLAELLKEDDKDFRFEVAVVLKDLGDEAGEALPALLLASKVPDSGGDEARKALDTVRKAPQSAAPAMIVLLKDEEPSIRLKAAEVLCDMEAGDKECLACLLGLIKRRDSQIRQRTTVLLARYGSAAKDPVPALIEVLRTDADLQTQRNAINALGAIGPDAKAAVPLLKALEKGYQKQLAEAEETLKRLGKGNVQDPEWCAANAAKVRGKGELAVVQAALTKIE
jgi:HEAT repeat protein